MVRIIKSTREKIERLTKLVESNTDVKEILKKEWQGSKKAKDKWVEKFKEHLPSKVVEVLTQGDTEETKKEKEEVTEVQSITESYSQEEVIKFLTNKDVFDRLKQMIAEQQEEEEQLRIPTEYLTAPTIVKSIRLDNNIYEEFTKVCKKYNLTISGCLNYAMAKFIEKYK